MLAKAPGKIAGRTEIRLLLETTSAPAAWRKGRWADDFVLVSSTDGQFITLFTRREDPAKTALMDFMEGRFDRLEARRCIPWSALLFRTLVAELVESGGTWDRGAIFPLVSLPLRPGYKQHPQYRPNTHRMSPFLSQGRALWITFGFTEEKAHRQALFCENQCERLISVYCHPTLTSHHRSRSPATEVVSLFALAKRLGRGAMFLSQIRFLTNHMRVAGSDAPFSQTLEDASACLQKAQGPESITTSALREARAALGIEISTFGEAAYAFAAANLLNAATNPKAGYYRGTKQLPKEVYSFKQRVGAWIERLVEEPLDGIAVYVPPKGSEDVIYVAIGEVQFSFHAVPLTKTIAKFSGSTRNAVQGWSGRRLQPIAQSVFAWGRAAFQVEGSDWRHGTPGRQP